MNDMRHLYGMEKSAAAKQAEFKESLAGFFRHVCTEGAPYHKTAAEKQDIVNGLLAKHAGCGKKAGRKQTVEQRKLASESENPAVRQLAAKIARARKSK